MAPTNTKSRPRRPAPPTRDPRPQTLTAHWQREIITALEAGVDHLADRQLPVARRIQKTRQATKTARALLRLAPTGMKRQARGWSVVLASVRKQLGALRDRDALYETLQLLAKEEGIESRQVSLLLRPLKPSSGQPEETTTAAGTSAVCSP